ncbi:MAG: ATP-binding cassette domain-containing protein [Gammaproteobacteria bacterium]|nr:ATP-binding cassette domain-containing protein [Gammaproteobacteria bacterium]
MITLRNITLRRGPNILLQDVSWTLYPKQRIGLIGANGAGKSSLFAMLLGILHPDSGDLEISKQLKLAHLAQETPAYSRSALDYVLDGDEELRKLEAALLLAEKENDGQRMASLHQHLSEIDAYTAKARAAQLLNGLGFNDREQQKSVSEFSGGWRVRLNLAKALMCRSDILLLDEPTNHLDLDAVLWLENWLMKYPGTLLIISHDRDFLDKVVDHIIHISNKQLKLYSGNYSTFEKQRAADLILQQASFEKQQKQLAHMQALVNRFRAKASKAKQAQSRVKAIERMELVSAVHADSPFNFAFKAPGPCPNPLVRLDNVTIAYGEKIILKDVNLIITPKDRIALLGPNGAGKSSLIKLIAGEITPAAGIREVGAGLKIGYFAQHQIDHLELDETPLHHMQKLAPKSKEQELRSFLGSFGFTGDQVLEKVNIFSGGEKSRLALALLVWQQPNLLLLDEPTNHLDLEMRHALSMALQDYQGAMILVSHDRFLVRSTVDQLSLVADGELNDFKGDLNDYQKWLFEFRRLSTDTSSSTTETDVSKKSQRQEAAKQRERLRPLQQKIKKYEDELERLQKNLTVIENSLADISLYEEKNKQKLQELLTEQIKITKQLHIIENDWLTACDELEKSNT